MITGGLPLLGLDLETTSDGYIVESSYVYEGYISAIIFAYLTIWLLISLFRTIFESPGTIPDMIEWDMLSETDETSDTKGLGIINEDASEEDKSFVEENKADGEERAKNPTSSESKH